MRLAATHRGLSNCFPLLPGRLGKLSQLEQERLDALAVRYARCQDLLVPAMRALGRAQLEPKAEDNVLSLLALMQKQGIAPSVADWDRQRSLRNAVGHQYPDPDRIVDILNGVYPETSAILSVVERLREAAEQLLS